MKATIIFSLIFLIAAIGVACNQAEPTFPPNLAPETDFSFFRPTVTPTVPAAPPPTPMPTTTTSPPPLASFTLDVSSGTAPFTVRFRNTSQGPVTSWEWDFGDGASSRGQNPTHEYTKKGTHLVQLRVSGPGGSDVTRLAGQIKVDPGPLSEIVASPPQITLQVQGATRFGAKALDQFGNEIGDVVLNWTTRGPGGGIDQTGLFVAATEARTYEGLVKVTATQGEQRREASIDVTITPGPVSAVIVNPAEITLDIGATQPFSFTALDEFGNEISDALSSWSLMSDVGVLDDNGVFTAGTKAGLFVGAIRMEVVKETERVAATVDLAIRPDPLATVEIEPSTSVIEMGATQRFTAKALDKYGNTIPGLAFLWKSEGGRITQEGHYSASESGSFHVTASASFKESVRSGLAFAIADVALVAWWPGEGNAKDVMGNHNGTVMNGATFAPGIVGQAFSFDGVGDFVSIPDSPGLDVSSITIEAWVNIRSHYRPAYNMASRWFVTPGEVGRYSWEFGIRGGRLGANISSDCIHDNHLDLIGNNILATDTWYHVVLVIDGTANKARWYLDGRLDKEFDILGFCADTNTLLQIGDGRGSVGIYGLMDEIRIYNRALSAGQIKARYDARSSGL